LYYRTFNEFREALDYLGSHDRERRALGAQGRAFVEREYRWPTVLARVEDLLARTLTSRASAASTAI
jgi:glycosyltransferase involved in cell wall biosynthesis